MKLSDFDYELPKELIAQKPAHPKSYSRLLISKKDKIIDTRFYNIIDYLKKGDLMIINTSKVSQAKLTGNKSTGSPAKVILLKQKSKTEFIARIQTRNPIKGTKLTLNGLKATITEQKTDIFTIKFEKEITQEILEKKATLPLPPYIKTKLKNTNDYQTAYAKENGSLAAPTAGLHFTKNLLKKIEKKGIEICPITLHVGFGTFLSIRREDLTKHKMEKEIFTITKDSADKINNHKGRTIIIGTTTLKALESADYKNGEIQSGTKASNLFIYPGHKFKTKLDLFVTNFHLPKSTLLLLVSALIGEKRIKKIYKHAIEQKYRFFSFGDAMMFKK